VAGAAASPTTTVTAPVAGHDIGFARGGGGDDEGGGPGGFISGLVHSVFNPRTLVFAGLGAAAACAIPPLAFLGGPIGGAIAGALLSFVL
jgi:hypothetical protein